MAQDKDEYITPDEAAELLSVSKRTVWRYLKAGKLRGLEMDSGTMVSRQSVLDHRTSGQIAESLNFNPDTHIVITKEEYDEMKAKERLFIEEAAKYRDSVTELARMTGKMADRIAELEIERSKLQLKQLEDKRVGGEGTEDATVDGGDDLLNRAKNKKSDKLLFGLLKRPRWFGQRA